MSYGLLFLRLVLGATLAVRGARTLSGLGRPVRSFSGLAAAGLVELLAGLLLSAGLLTPVAALAIAAVLVAASGLVWLRGGLSWELRGAYGYELVVWAAAVAVAATGPGRFSLDALFGAADELSGLWWGVAILLLSLLLGGAASALRRAAARGGRAAPAGGRRAVVLRDATFREASALRDGALRVRASHPPVAIEVGQETDGIDLIECLLRHGFAAHLADDHGHCHVEVSSGREEPLRLLGDLALALETWVPDRARAGLVLRVAEVRHAAGIGEGDGA
jgi:putative oxidoreductase